MKRLTYLKRGNWWVVKIGDTEHSGPVADRLAAYEDTGLEPKEIITLCSMSEWAKMADLLRLEDYQALGSINHLRELAQAEKDGRLVVLPCKTGDILWTYYPSRSVYSFKVTGVSTLDGKTMLNTDILHVISASDVGKTVFLTRAEAEAALEATCDILVHYGVLSDDHCGIAASHDGSRVLYDKQNPRAEIEIERAVYEHCL